MPSWGEYTNDLGTAAARDDESTLAETSAVHAPVVQPEEIAAPESHDDGAALDAVAAPTPPPSPGIQGRDVTERKRERRSRRTKGRGKRLVGLKVGASQLAAATVENNGSPHLVSVARTDLEPGVVVGGEVRDPEALATALKSFFKTHKLPTKNVRLGIATNRVGVRTFDLPAIGDRRQLDNAIRFRAQEVLPVPVNDAVLDYQVLADGPAANGEATQRVLLVVTYRELVERYVRACRDAGLHLVGIDLEAFALLRALTAPEERDAVGEAALVVVSVGHDRTTLAVSDGRTCDFTRVLQWGGATLNEEIGRVLNVAPSAAEPIKRLVGLTGGDTPDGVSAEQAASARQAIGHQVHSLAGELVSSLRFYQEQPGSLGFGEIVVTGGTAHLPGFAEELQRLLNVPVRVGDPLAAVTLGKKAKVDERTGSLTVAIGLGIEE